MSAIHDYAPDEREKLPLDATCPHCNRNCDIGEAFDGEHWGCRNCGARLVAVVGETAWMALLAPPPLTGRQRTRRLWQKRGRR